MFTSGERVCSQSVIIPPVTQCGHTKHSGDWGNKACDFSWTPQRLLGNVRHLVGELISVTYDCVLTYPLSSVLSRFSSACLHTTLLGGNNPFSYNGFRQRTCQRWGKEPTPPRVDVPAQACVDNEGRHCPSVFPDMSTCWPATSGAAHQVCVLLVG